MDHRVRAIAVSKSHRDRLGATFYPPPGVGSPHGVRQASSRGSSSRRNHLQRQNMGAAHVKVGNRYRMEEGEIEVDSIKPMVVRISLGSWRAIRVSYAWVGLAAGAYTSISWNRVACKRRETTRSSRYISS